MPGASIAEYLGDTFSTYRRAYRTWLREPKPTGEKIKYDAALPRLHWPGATSEGQRGGEGGSGGNSRRAKRRGP